jgi:hypothetical protein
MFQAPGKYACTDLIRAAARYRLFLIALAASVAATAAAQESVPLARAVGPIVLDGVPDEESWRAVDPLPLVMYQPVYGGDMSEETEIRVAYDDEYVYMAGTLFDRDARGVRANSMYRDQYSGDDTFAIILDTFNDNENALWFFTTPNGTRVDMAISNDVQDGRGSMNRSWNTFWDVSTSQSPEGWTAELRIPLSSLGFQAVGDHVEMGLIAYRYIARRNERHIFPDIRPDWDMAFAKPSLAQTVTLTGVKAARPVYVSPFAVAGADRRTELNVTETDYVGGDDFPRDIGLDVKYNLTSNLTLDLTANTDFAQVEADDQVVNLTRFSLDFPEKRQFFQERAGLFDFNLGGSNRVFNSRNIGLDEDGNPVRILGGTRLVGKVGAWDIGLINMQTDDSSLLPHENFGAVRARRRVFNDYSFAGSIFTSRIGSDGSYNFVYGADATVRVGGDEYLTLQWVQSLDDALIAEAGASWLPSSAIRARWARRTSKGLSYSATLTRVGEEYRPDVGFQTRENYFQSRGSISYGWFSDGNSPFRNVSSGLEAFTFLDNEDGSVQSAAVQHEWDLELMSGERIGIDVQYQVENLDEDLRLSTDAWVPIGRYHFVSADARYRMPTGYLFRTDVEFSGGKFYDGRSLSVGVEPTWNVSRFLELGGEAELTRLRFPDRDQSFDFVLTRLRSQLAFSKSASVAVFLQYSSAADLVTANVRFRLNFREGRDLWIVLNDVSNTDRYRGLPVLPATGSRALLIKYTHTFAL